MPDEFGPRIEADAYRITLWIEQYPDEIAVKRILRVGDDASVSFAKEWLHDCQPDTCAGSLMYDRWLVEKFYTDHVYRPVATGAAERPCKRKRRSKKGFRRRIEERAGASEILNGFHEGHAIDREVGVMVRAVTSKRRKGARVLKRAQETYAQKRIKEMREIAKRQLREGG